jgi:hypothetical protein
MTSANGEVVAQQAAPRCANAIATLVSVQGRVEIYADGKWTPADLDQRFCGGDRVRTANDSRAEIYLRMDETILKLNEQTSVRLPRQVTEGGRSLLDILSGAVHLFSRTPRRLDIQTPHINGGIDGTEFLVLANAKAAYSLIHVFEGLVAARAEGAQDAIGVSDGETLVAAKDQRPRQLNPADAADQAIWPYLARPLNSIQWTFFYPPLATTSPDPTIARVQTLLHAGQADDALALLDANSDRAEMLALQAIILSTTARTAKEKAAAIDVARRAVSIDPSSADALIALSYALQADFQVDAALDVLSDAAFANNAYALARLAELHLINDDLRKANRLSKAAVAVDPRNAQALTIRGFVHLAALSIDKAIDAFTHAIALDSADPRARLGLGLAHIRAGRVADGREQIELAVPLDYGDSLIKSYLGRAYFEEGRWDKARAQYGLAKQFDDADPTPWFFDGVQSLLENQPIKALRQLRQSIARNDNRLIYRSPQSVSQDRAARGAALANIYQKLDMPEQGLAEVGRSLARAPTNHAAHRMTAELYKGDSRQDFGRASELLQAKLYQPLTLDAIAPQDAAADLLYLGGAGFSQAGANEFSSLFETDGYRLSAAATAGNYDTWSDEVLLSMVQGRAALSVGQFHYETDGFRDNNDIRHDLVNVLAQFEPTPHLMVQAEYAYRDSEQGDLRLNFDPDEFLRTSRRSKESHMARLGARIEPARGHVIVADFSYRDERRLVSEKGTVLDLLAPTKLDAFSAQIQHVARFEAFTLTSGFEWQGQNGFSGIIADFSPSFGGLCPLPSCISEFGTGADEHRKTAYSYLTFDLLDWSHWTVGVSYTNSNVTFINVDRLLPKIGVEIEVTPAVRVRGSYAAHVGDDSDDQTLEPTFVGGAEQFFDDEEVTLPRQVSGGIDVRLNDNLDVNAAVNWRQVDARMLDLITDGWLAASIEKFGQRANLSYRLNDFLAFSAHPKFEKILLGGAYLHPSMPNFPKTTETFETPVSLAFFAYTGWHAKLTGTYVAQWLEVLPYSTLTETKEDFLTFDLEAGYQFPNQRGAISLSVKNLFGTNFRYQDGNTIEGQPGAPEYVPETLFVAKASLRF